MVSKKKQSKKFLGRRFRVGDRVLRTGHQASKRFPKGLEGEVVGISWSGTWVTVMWPPTPGSKKKRKQHYKWNTKYLEIITTKGEVITETVEKAGTRITIERPRISAPPPSRAEVIRAGVARLEAERRCQTQATFFVDNGEYDLEW